MNEEDAITVGGEFVRELRDLGDKYGLDLSHGSCARFYAEHFQTAILRRLHKQSVEKDRALKSVKL